MPAPTPSPPTETPFRLLFEFAQKTLGKPPCSLDLPDLDVSLIGAFLNDLEQQRNNGARTRNLRLTAIRSFAISPACMSPRVALTFNASSPFHASTIFGAR